VLICILLLQSATPLGFLPHPLYPPEFRAAWQRRTAAPSAASPVRSAQTHPTRRSRRSSHLPRNACAPRLRCPSTPRLSQPTSHSWSTRPPSHSRCRKDLPPPSGLCARCAGSRYCRR
jgi:hypothetical protein